MQSIGSSDQYGKQVSVDMRQINDREVQVSVTDGRPGVPPDRVADIFEPLYSGTSGGMGMGLAISRAIIEAHGEATVVRTEPCRGRHLQVCVANGRVTTMMEEQTVQTVFVVDDDAAVRDSIAELVESVGLLAKCYASALAFLDALEPDRPGCLVLDLRMAEMSGLVLQQKFRALGVRIPVIVLTGHGDVPMAAEPEPGACLVLNAGAGDLVDPQRSAQFAPRRAPGCRCWC